MYKILAELSTALLLAMNVSAKDYVSMVNTLQGSYNTPEFSHGRCTPTVGYPFGVNIWMPSAFNYARNIAGGIGGSGLSLVPLITADEPIAAAFDLSSVEGHPNLFKFTRKNGATVELTSTERCAVARFSYPRSKEKIIVVIANGEIEVSGNVIDGYSDVKANYYGVSDRNYFRIEFDRPPMHVSKDGQRVMAYFSGKSKIIARIGVSRVSANQAVLNLEREVGSLSFDQVKDASWDAWNAALGKIDVEGGTVEQQKTFYSCLFKTYIRPARNYDIDADGNAKFSYNTEVFDGKYHSNPILWDAYRCLFALHDIVDVREQEEYVQSLVRTKELSGWWPSGHVMIGNHAISVLADAWAKGIRTFDPNRALDYYYKEVTCSKLDTLINGSYNADHLRGYGRMGWEEYFTLGYISYPQNTDRVMETTSKTIEYNYDDFCAYKLACMTGNEHYKEVFGRQLFNYRNVFDPSDCFFKGRDTNGRFDSDFNPFEWGGAFVEGNGWQWRFAVQQDAAGMIQLMGGEDNFREKLDDLFKAPSDSVLYGGYGYWIHEITEAVAGGQGQYAQGNEPCFHVIHLYNHAGQPWKAQAGLRESMSRLYDSSPKGFPGDEDGGAMSAWYVFNAMGFYPVTPGVAEYTIGSPLFNKVTIFLENGKKFVIQADGNCKENVYIESAELNGKNYDLDYLTHDDIMNGGIIKFVMSSAPNFIRGTSKESRPYSLSSDISNQ